MEPGNNYRNNPRGTNSEEEERRAQAELMWDDRLNGMTNKRIAEKYGIGQRTVTNRFKEFPKEGFDRSLKTQNKGGPGNEMARVTLAAEMWEAKTTHGYTNRKLAELYDISEKSVSNYLNNYFPEKSVVALEKQRVKEVDKLDFLEETAMQLMNEECLVVDKGKVVIDPRNGAPMIDLSNKFQAIDRILKIAERRSKLVGLDAPKALEVTHNAGADIQVTEIQNLVEEAKRRQAQAELEIRAALGSGEIVDAELVDTDEEDLYAGDTPTEEEE